MTTPFETSDRSSSAAHRDISRRSVLRAAGLTALATTVGVTAVAKAAPARASVVNTTSLVDPTTPTGAAPLVATAHNHLVFSDEFHANALNASRWNALEVDRGAGNSGVDYWYKADNVSVQGGTLALAISKLAENSYGGSRVDTQGKYDFTFGTIEQRVHVPPTTGHLAALWLQAANGLTPGGVTDGTARDGAEIDIAETFSPDDEYGVTIHWDGYGAAHQESNQVVQAPGLHESYFHTFTTEWTNDYLNFYFDGTLVRSITDPILISQVPEFIILSNEVIPYAQGNITTSPLDSSADVYVDYVRVWQ